MKLSVFISIIFVCVLISGCGGSGGGGGTSGNATFKQDMKWLSSSSMVSAKSVDTQMNGALSKAFGGTTKADVSQFISERIKYVYHVSEAANFKVSAYSSGAFLGETTMRELMGGDMDPSTDFTAAMNIGAGLAMSENENNIDLKVHLPEGIVDAGSYRMGLVFLTKYYWVLPTDTAQTIQQPTEGRISTLVHEARHSDCPNGEGQPDCGFGHRECSSGPAAGLPACDNSFWGPYAMGALYLRGTQDNHAMDSMAYRLIEFMADDSLSRLDAAQKNALLNSDPQLNSF